MRYILQRDVYERLPPDWDDKVVAAKEYVERKVEQQRREAEDAGRSLGEIQELCLKARHKAINSKSDVWRYAQNALSFASHEKCWYCESKQNRSDMPVDHFRPKNSIVEAPGHPGYYWLAFNWKNYRYSCTYCNSKRCDVQGNTSGGKHDHFPVIPPPPHQPDENGPVDKAKLLDPVDDADPKLIIFSPNGYPRPANGDQTTVERVEESIRLYHLDHISLVRQRKMIGDKIDEHVSRAENARIQDDHDTYKYHKTEIIALIRAQAECSSAARTYLSAYRDSAWVEELVLRDL